MANRWWGPPSGFPWEEEALAYVREWMPENEPYRAWQTFTFTADDGHVYECDLLIATPSGLYLVEIKSHPGRVVNSGSDWTFHMPDGRVRTIDNPLHLTNHKAKKLKEQLGRGAKLAGSPRLHIPFITPVVFLSAPGLDCRLDEYQRIAVYARDGRPGLPGIRSDLVDRKARDAKTLSDVTAFSKQMDKVRAALGLQGARRAHKIGSLELERRPMDRGAGWEDFLARNPAMKSDPPRRVRVYLSQQGATKEQKRAVARAARREYKSLIGVEHDGIVRAENYSDEHDDGPAIVFRHGDGWQRLDHFMSERGAGLEIETRVEMVRQLAEAVDHAHRRRLYHRALSARSVYVDLVGGYPRLRIADWQTAARERGESQPDSSDSDPPSSDGSLQERVDDSSVLYRAPEFGQPAAEGGLLDVFGLGALAYLLLTGRPPAADQGELQTTLRTERALIPSAVGDEITPGMDELVRQATAVEVTERTLRVRDFLNRLEDVEEELTAPQAEVVDPLEAGKDSVIEGWTVERVLGKGSTARALLVAKDGHHRVLKVGLNDDANLRLMSEAETLDKLHSHYVVRMIEGPRFVHVAGVERAFIIMEQAGPRTLAEELRMRGRLPAAGPLEKLGEDLLRALEYLEEAGVWHRDIKPANLAIQKVEKQRERLVLFDFSLSGAAADRIQAGTPPYLDPFLGIGDRTEYDDAAERYAAAVTLHEMATGELPSWADGVIPAEYADADELTPQVSSDMLDERVRDKLAAFFRRALHRDAGARYRSAKEMVRAWMETFGELDRDTTPTTRDTLDDDLGAEETNRRLAETADPATSLRVAGLSGRAQSVAEQQLHVSTVGELMEVPTARIRTVRGVGIEIRNELARKAKMWRRKFKAGERADTSRLGEPARLTVDQFTDRLLPAETGRNETQRRVVRLTLALPGPGDTEPEVPAWAAQGEVGRAAGVHQSTVAQTLGKARQSWLKLGKIMSTMREDVLAILDDHGRVLGAAQLAGELLNLRGCTSDDPTARRAYAEAAVRAVVETEDQRDKPVLLIRRAHGRVLVARNVSDDPSVPAETELIDYALRLGEAADRLVVLDDQQPLPGVTQVRSALGSVARPDGMAPLPDTDLVALAAAASRRAAVTPRLELYPTDLPPVRALRLTQLTTLLAGAGASPEAVRARVDARFPELTAPPPPEAAPLRSLMREAGYPVEYVDVNVDGMTQRWLRLPGTSLAAGGPSGSSIPLSYLPGAGPADDLAARLETSLRRGGFLAIKADVTEAEPVTVALAERPGVTAIDVTRTFLRTMRAIVDGRGWPDWSVVLDADRATAEPDARAGFAELVAEAWDGLRDQITAEPPAPGTAVLLHMATPLIRYPGGTELLAKLIDAARDAHVAPWALWLLCPMDDPDRAARLDGHIAGAQGENEQLAVPRGLIPLPLGRAS